MKIQLKSIVSAIICGFMLLLGAQTAYSLTATEVAKLVASDAGHIDFFGGSVAVSGDTAVIGGDEAAYVFTRTGTSWSEQAKLTASDAAAGDDFGASVAVSGDTVVIGAANDIHAGIETGAAYVFTRTGTTWTEQAKLTASDAAAGDDFGSSVAASGDTAVIGAPWAGADGSAYVFTRTGTSWTEQAKLTGIVWDEAAEFGASVAVSGDTAVIGSPYDPAMGTDSGSAYVFTRSGTTWTEEARFWSSDIDGDDFFGVSLAISDDTVVVGTLRGYGYEHPSGAAYVFSLVTDVIDVAIDIKFHSRRNKIDLRSEKTIWVTVWSDTDNPFDALQINIESVRFGPNGAKVIQHKVRDYNEDGLADLVLRFMVGETGIACGDAQASLIGGTYDGQLFSGTDSVKTMGCPLTDVNDVDIDIKFHSRRNKIDLRYRRQETIWVTVWSDTDSPFDALQIKKDSVRFGPYGAKVIKHKVRDYNEDGLADLVLRFEVRRTGIACGDTQASLTGETYDGQRFSGTDSVMPVGPRC